MTINQDLAEKCLMKAFDGTTVLEAADYDLTYIQLIVVKYDRNIMYAQEEELREMRLKGL